MKLAILFSIMFLLLLAGCTQTTTQNEIQTTTQAETTESPTQEIEEPLAPETIGTSTESTEPKRVETETQTITLAEFQAHSTPEDCWIEYENKVYDYSGTSGHPSMDKVIFSHCGKLTFEEAAKAKHSGSNEKRAEQYGPYVGDLE